MEKKNQNIPIFNFVFSSLKEKNNDIKENILLGNIHFPSTLKYSPNNNIFNSKSHKLFLNNLTNKLNLIKISEEKQILNNKIELSNNKLNILNKNYKILCLQQKNKNYILSSNKVISKSISSIDSLNTLPLIKENNSNKKNKMNKINLLEIKPIIKKEYTYRNKIMNDDKERVLEQNAKDFIKRLNESKINKLSLKKEKQEKDFLKLQKQIEIMDKKRKMREEFEFQRKNNERIEKVQKQNINISNNKFPNKKYHYYNKNLIPKKILLKNFTEEIVNFNSPLYYDNNNPQIFNQMYNANRNNNIVIELNSNNRINTDVNIPINRNNNIMVVDNNDNMIPFDKKHIYYFNQLKYEY